MNRELPDDWIVCNCANCQRILLSDAMRDRHHEPTFGYWYVAARVDGRPYCRRCLRSRQRRAALVGAQ
jgi:hypothetical protein